eukprot:3099484-Rhodomonas_salina.1
MEAIQPKIEKTQPKRGAGHSHWGGRLGSGGQGPFDIAGCTLWLSGGLRVSSRAQRLFQRLCDTSKRVNAAAGVRASVWCDGVQP